MILFRINDRRKIFPYKTEQVLFWTKKWGIKSSELNEAIISTGSLRINVLKDYLVKKGSVISASGIAYNFKTRLKKIIDKWNDEDDF